MATMTRGYVVDERELRDDDDAAEPDGRCAADRELATPMLPPPPIRR